MNNIEFYYKQWCEKYVITPKKIARIESDEEFTKLIGKQNQLLYARKNPIDVRDMQKGFSIGKI